MTGCAECGGRVKAKGLCNAHYLRLARATDPERIAANGRRAQQRARERAIVAWYDAELSRAGDVNPCLPVGEVLVDAWQVQGALSLLTKLHSRRPETMLYDPDYEFTGGLLRCFEAGRAVLGLGWVDEDRAA